MQNAVEPVHVQFNQNDSTVAVINRTHKATGNLTVQADLYSIDSKSLYHQTATAALSKEGTQQVIPLQQVLKTVNQLCFVVLGLKDAKGNIVSRNIYWTAPGNDYTPLNTMKKADVKIVSIKPEFGKAESKWTITLSNTGNQLAFFVRPQLMVKGEEVMPAYWSSSYFALSPKETVTIIVSAPRVKLTAQPSLHIEGWNVNKVDAQLTSR
jgi:hypothetical protein